MLLNVVFKHGGAESVAAQPLAAQALTVQQLILSPLGHLPLDWDILSKGRPPSQPDRRTDMLRPHSILFVKTSCPHSGSGTAFRGRHHVSTHSSPRWPGSLLSLELASPVVRRGGQFLEKLS